MNHSDLLKVLKTLPEDYEPYGKVDRWAEGYAGDGNDCSCGCKYAAWLDGPLGTDWCICANSESHRSGMLTFEHQGCSKFEKDE